MAFYHVGSCNCPVGCCDCGEPDLRKDHLWWDEKHEVIFCNKWTLKDYKYWKGVEDIMENPHWLINYIESHRWTYLGLL